MTQQYSKGTTPPPCAVCGMPTEFFDTRAHWREHDRLRKERRKGQRAREREAREWLASQHA